MTPLLLASAACAGDKPATVDSAGGTMAMTDSAAGASTGAMNTPNNAGAMDAPVAQLLATVNRGEIGSGQLASTKARNAEVKAFAQQMVQEHETAMATLTTLASSSGWSIDSAAIMSGAGNMAGMSDSAHAAMSGAGGATGQSGAPALTSALQQMQQTMSASMQKLRGQSGATFDRAYMDAQLAGHQQTLDLLRQYGTSIQNTELRSHATQIQASVEQHLQKAKDIRAKLGGTTGS